MKKYRVIGLFLALVYLAVMSTSVNAATVVMDNDGLAKSTPYGDSGMPTSYKDLDYYDCYLPYKVTIREIGGYADGVRSYVNSGSNFSMTSAHPNQLDKALTHTVMREFSKSGDLYKGCKVTTEADTGMDIITDSNGNQYYVTAIQNFFYNFGGLAVKEGTSFPGFSSANRGQLVDVMLTDGTCIHFIVGDGNSIGHTNGGPSTLQDVTYNFSSLNMPQYKNLFQAANGNCLEVWGKKEPNCVANFKNKYNLKEDGVKIAYYRMYNSFINNSPIRADSAGSNVSYSMGTSSIGNSTAKVGSSALVSEWELVGMPTISELKSKQLGIYLPTRKDLTIKEANSVVLLGRNISLEKSVSALNTARISVVFLGLTIVLYSIFIFVAMIFDLINSFIDINLVHILTFGLINYMPKELGFEESKGVYTTKKLIFSNAVLIIVGMILLSGGVLPIMGNIVFGISQKLL